MSKVGCHDVFFFFSSRRRHTRLQGDWSSTCALPICGRSDARGAGARSGEPGALAGARRRQCGDGPRGRSDAGGEIGRAACSGRGEVSVGGVSLKKKKNKDKMKTMYYE